MKYVYVISTDDGFTKIGVARHPKRRLHNLQVSCHHQLTLCDAFLIRDTDRAFEVEAEAHRRLEKHRVRGEWFAVTPQQAADILVDIVYGSDDRVLRLSEFPKIERQAQRWAGRTLVCPYCSHQSSVNLDNSTIFKSIFKCTGCAKRIPGHKFFIRRVV